MLNIIRNTYCQLKHNLALKRGGMDYSGSLTIPVKGDENVTVEFPAGDQSLKSAYAFGIIKNGSTMLHNLFRHLALQTGHTAFSLPDELFMKGVPVDKIDSDDVQMKNCRERFRSNGYFFIGFRGYPGFLGMAAEEFSRSVLLVRDPRDALVSHYFSVLYSHTVPSEKLWISKSRKEFSGTDIDDFVTNPKIIKRMKARYNSYLALPKEALILRYEDYILDKRSLVMRILEFLDLKISDSQIEKVASSIHQIPSKEDQSQHIRKALPGDHKQKLSHKTILELNDKFAEIMERYGYFD